jgi:hypothetical protein
MTVDIMSCNVNTIEKVLEKLFRIEYGTVVEYDKFGLTGVQCRDDPHGKFWNTVTVRVRTVKTRVSRVNKPTGETGDPYKIMHYYCTVLQNYTQKFGGHPYTPRVGDMVVILFIYNQMPLVLGTVNTDTQDPVCRAPFNVRDVWLKDARYDDVEKWCQWEHPKFNENQEVVEHYPGKHPICKKKFHRNRDQINVTDCIEGNKKPCNLCESLDHVKRCGNQWEKIYSDETDARDPEHPYLPCCNESTKRRHEWHEPCGSYFVFQNRPWNDPDYGRGLIRLENAISESLMKAHLNMAPTGTVDIHTQHEDKIYSNESEGTRMSVMALDDSSDDHSFEAIDFSTNSLIEILKTGDITLSSLSGICNVQINGTEGSIEMTATEAEMKGNLTITGDLVIKGKCTHAKCSCITSETLGWSTL